MAHIILSAKASNDWTFNEPHALNISIEPLTPISFFGVASLPDPTTDAILLSNVTRPPASI
ncbi:hypothetical protein B0H10DRAFT_1773401 [Mycena sp. CBHHK59/15]|nr:hypothetical protein B0H10DRAFT_1773401 [Mycena sp. CBHHK59/15]